MKRKSTHEVYWLGKLPTKDDFGLPYIDVMIDGRTKMGTWANMTATSWQRHGIGLLGTGYGQMYKKQPDGSWLKVQG